MIDYVEELYNMHNTDVAPHISDFLIKLLFCEQTVNQKHLPALLVKQPSNWLRNLKDLWVKDRKNDNYERGSKRRSDFISGY